MQERAARGHRSELSPRALRRAPVCHAPGEEDRVDVLPRRDELRLEYLGKAAVKSGRAASLSAWVNTALVERAATERRLAAMGDAIAAYEAEFGEISAAELLAQQRADRRSAVLVGPMAPVASRRRAVPKPKVAAPRAPRRTA